MIQFSSLALPLNHFKHEINSIVTEQQKKIGAVAFFVISCLALVYLFYRCCCFKAQPIDLDDSGAPSRDIHIDEDGKSEMKNKLLVMREKGAPQKGYKEDVKAQISVGVPLYERGEYKEAKKHFKKAMQLDSKSVEAINHYARCLLRLGSKDKAEQYFERALKIGPRNTLALTGHAEALLELGKIPEAKLEIRKALQIDISSAWAPFVEAEILYAEGDLKGANDAYLLAMENSKMENITGHLMRLNKLGKPQVVVWLSQELLQRKNSSDYRAPLNAFAERLRLEESFDVAAQVFEKLVQHDPKDFFSLSRYGDVLMHLNRAPEALKILSQAVSIEKEDMIKDLVFVSAVGKSLLKQGHLDLADGYFMLALLAAPDDLYARNQHAYILSEQGALDEAESNFKQVLESEPNNIFALNHYAEVLFKQDKFQDALDLFEEILTLDPQDAFALSYLTKTQDALKAANG